MISAEVNGYSFVERYEQVDSTMNVARQKISVLLSSGGTKGLVTARRQTAGRGRQGKSWSSAAESFMGTFLFRSRSRPERLGGYSLAVGVGIARALQLVGAEVRLKWPNDIVVSHDALGFRKLGGILIEMDSVGEELVVLVGVGVNLIGAPDELPRSGDLKSSCGVTLSLDKVVFLLANAVGEVHETFERQGFASFLEEWNGLSLFNLGEEILVDTGARKVAGTFNGVNSNGSMSVVCQGVTEEIFSGHVEEWRGIPIS